MPIDVNQVRADTPGCLEIAHLNNAGAALQPRPVIEAVIDHIHLESRLGGYEAAAQAKTRLEGCYGSIARLLNCRPGEIAIVENATFAWDMAFYAMDFRPGDRILTARAEYASNYIAFLQVARRTGAVIEAIGNDSSGQIDVAALRRAIDDRVKLIAITHIPTNGGLINPAAEVGRVAREAGIPFLLDACQSAGQMPLDVEELGCDMLSATGRKFLRAPRGTGFLYVREPWISRLEPPFLDLHSAAWTGSDSYEIRADARRFENWECNIAAKIGLGVAVDYALGVGLESIRDRCRTLADHLRRQLSEVTGIIVHDLGREKSAIVSFSKAGMDARSLADRLAKQQINVSVSNRGSTYLDMQARGLAAILRASPHYYNTKDEVDRLVHALRD